jgi:hypothetical protein
MPQRLKLRRSKAPLPPLPPYWPLANVPTVS